MPTVLVSTLVKPLKAAFDLAFLCQHEEMLFRRLNLGATSLLGAAGS